MSRLTDFLAAFFPQDEETIYFRAFKAKGAPDASDNRPILEATSRQRLATDTSLQGRMASANKTRGWYFVVNSGGNTDAEILRCNAFFVESDSLSIQEQNRRLNASPLEPSMRVETRKSVHAYWLIEGVCDIDAWKEVQQRLIAHFDGDKSIKNPSRVMRLPFFNHVHYDEQTGNLEYKRIELHTFQPEKRYTLSEMQEALPQMIPVNSPDNSNNGNQGSTQGIRIAAKVEDVISNGLRHKTLLSLAGSMRRRGMRAEEIAAALKLTNQLRCHPPLDESEVLELCQDVAERYKPEDRAKQDNAQNSTGSNTIRASEFRFTPLDQLLAEPEEDVSFVWGKTLPVGGFSICSAKPKVGKSTLARNLAVAVSRGEPFLGRDTIKGRVLYLCLEEKRGEVAKHFRRMNASDKEILIAFVTPENALIALQTAIADYEPQLTIIDPLSRIVRVRDFNDYGAMSRALEPLIDLARKTACHILALHHDGKGERDGGDALLGSTALFGAVDCHIQMKKRERGRTILTTQRYGEDLPETVVELEAETGLVIAQGDLQTVLLIGKKAEILSSMSETEELSEADIKERVGGNQQGVISKAIRSLVEESKLARNGAGKKGDPYTYRKTPIPSENLVNLENPQSDDRPEARFSRSVYIEEPRNLEIPQTLTTHSPSGRLFDASPTEREASLYGAIPRAYTYHCIDCSAIVSSEDTHCPNCEKNLNDLPF